MSAILKLSESLATVNGTELPLAQALNPAVLAAMPAAYGTADWISISIDDMSAVTVVHPDGAQQNIGTFPALLTALNSVVTPKGITPTAAAVKQECQRRIYAVLKNDQTQNNIGAHALGLVAKKALGGALTSDELAELTLSEKLRAWVADMQAHCRLYVAADDAVCATDDKWPAAPEGGKEFAARF